MLDKKSYYKVHALAVAYLCVKASVGHANIVERVLSRGRVSFELKIADLRSLEVDFNVISILSVVLL